MTQDSVNINDSMFSFAGADTINQNQPKSFFTSTQYFPIQEKEINKDNQDWMFAVLFVGFLLFTLVSVFNRKRLNNIIKGFFAKRLVTQLVREGNIITDGMSVSLFLIYLLNISLLIYLALWNYVEVERIRYWGIVFYLQLFIIVLLFLFIKFLFFKISQQLFKTYELTTLYISNHFVFNFFEGIVLIPLLTLVIYLPGGYSGILLVGSVFLIIIIYFFRLIRGLLIGLSSKKFRLFQLILYFCSHEIIPVLLLIKISKEYLF